MMQERLKCTSDLENLVIWAIACTAFYGFFPVGRAATRFNQWLQFHHFLFLTVNSHIAPDSPQKDKVHPTWQ